MADKYGHSWGEKLEGTQSADFIFGDGGDDVIVGYSGDDKLIGGAGSDVVYANDGHDTLLGGTGDDQLHGDLGSDALYGEEDDDTIWGDAGFDLCDGGDGNDKIYGGDNGDWLFGGADHDVLEGGKGMDWLDGGSGPDSLIGGADRDVMFGGDGVDIFSFSIPNGWTDSKVENPDIINDFEEIEGINMPTAGTSANYIEKQFDGRASGYDVAKVWAENHMTGDDRYVFVSDGVDGYLFGDLNGSGTMETGIVLVGISSISDFDWQNII